VGIYSDRGHVIAYADGEVRQEFSICFTARIVGGQFTVSDQESTEGGLLSGPPVESAIEVQLAPPPRIAAPLLQ